MKKNFIQPKIKLLDFEENMILLTSGNENDMDADEVFDLHLDIRSNRP